MSKSQKRIHKISDRKLFDKYALYKKSVQSPETDVIFLRKIYKEIRKKDPLVMREDFCGTFALSCEWVKLNSRFKAYALDLDPEPLEYGKSHYTTRLNDQQKKRLQVLEQDVLLSPLPAADIVAALNFSFFLFKTRELMRKYFSNVLKSLKKDGIFVLDLFGGSLCQAPNEEKTKHKTFTYYWDQSSFDPITQYAQFYIHFRLKGRLKKERIFSYDWRLWTLPELRELLHEVGFAKTHIYWEGTTRNGSGDGVFTRTEKGEPCQSWIAYISAEK